MLSFVRPVSFSACTGVPRGTASKEKNMQHSVLGELPTLSSTAGGTLKSSYPDLGAWLP